MKKHQALLCQGIFSSLFGEHTAVVVIEFDEVVREPDQCARLRGTAQ